MADLTFNEFTSRLFPGDELPVRNPASLPGAAVEILEDVSCRTGVPVKWLKKSARLVLDGVAGAQCLWYLHGLEGELVAAEGPKNKYGMERDLDLKIGSDNYNTLLGIVVAEEEKGVRPVIDWSDGYVTLGKRKMKLGKWLRKWKASKELLKAFETRELPAWKWRISTHPVDVLTMSFNRPWVSCMRPGGAAELGPLTDMAAGTSVMFFHRPGAKVPCGRTLLRPALKGQSRIMLWSGYVYGCGPKTIDVRELRKDLAKKTRHNIPVGNVRLCPFGKSGDALTRNIYSDVDREYCAQSNEAYDKAYAKLLDAKWPPSKLDLGDLPMKAAEVKKHVENVNENELLEYARSAIEIAFAGWAMECTLNNLRELDIPNLVDMDYEYLRDTFGIEDDDLDEIIQMVNERRDEMIMERFYITPIRVLLLTDMDEYTEIDIEAELSLIDYYRHAYFDFPPFNFSDEKRNEALAELWEEGEVTNFIAAPTDTDLDDVAATAKNAGVLVGEIKIDPNARPRYFHPRDFGLDV